MPFELNTTAIPDVVVVVPKTFRDARGEFTETYNRRDFAALGLTDDFCQDNHVVSSRRFTLRGLHFQTEPFVQAKLVRAVRGAIFDVAVDIRRGSPTYGRHVAATLTAANGWQLYVPPGFAHGYLTLEDNAEVAYKVTGYYSAASSLGLLWSDPALGIAWPLESGTPVLAPQDETWPALAALAHHFTFGKQAGA